MTAPKTPAGELLREVARLYTRAQRVVADCCGTTSTQCHLLVELGRSGPVPLVERGLVTKEPNPADARSWLVTLTADGDDRVRDLNGTLDNHASRLLDCLNERDRAHVEKSLLLILKALREETDIAACCAMPAAGAGKGNRTCR
jgi:hypothetical protein